MWLLNTPETIKKYNKFNKFFDKNYRMTKKVYTERELMSSNDIKEFDDITTFICESDVIWSPDTTEGFDNGYFLNFPSTENKTRIAYAASIGNTNFSDENKEKFRKLVNRLDAISIREIQGVEFTQNFTNKNVRCVLDPTLLLKAEDYEDIIKEPKEKGYVLVYNCLSNNKAMVKAAKKLADSMNLQLIEISTFILNRRLKCGKVKIDIGVEEFLGLFKNASFVVTNAFHGTCFSLIFGKDFYTYSRSDKDSRMTSILKQLGIEERFVEQNTRKLENKPINYKDVNCKLDTLREESIKYLLENIK